MKKIILVFALLLSFAANAQKKPVATAKKASTDYCSEIQEVTVETKTSFITPVIDGITIKKVKKDGFISYIGKVEFVSETNMTKALLVVMFDNLKSIDKADVRVLPGLKKNEYVAFFIIEDDELSLFKDNTVKGVSIGDETWLCEQKVKLQKLVNCLVVK